VRNSILAVAAIVATFVGVGAGFAQNDPNPAMNAPDLQAWRLFMTVNAKAAGANNALFETWARDDDTFRPQPVWPTTSPPVQPGPRALSLVAQRAHPGMTVQVVPGGANLVGEETRRNRADFDFIVQNSLFKVSGLQAAFKSAKPIAFPIDSMEVKANWVEVGRLKEFNQFGGTPAEAAKLYHVNSVSGKA
jgi:hypothetical protein